MTDLPEVEKRITAHLPGLRITDRSLRLRTIKFMGHLLDESEKFVDTIPVFETALATQAGVSLS